MQGKLLKIDMDYLVFACQDLSLDNAYYLDTECGEICLVNRELLDLKDLTDEIENASDRFLYIPKAGQEELIKDLHEFVDSVTDSKLQNILSVAFESPHVVQAFRSILTAHSDEWSRLEKFLTEKTRRRVLLWLNANGLAPE